MKILEPIIKKDRRVTQGFGENFEWKGKPMYGIGGWIPSWKYHMGIDYSSRENKFGDIKPLPIRAGITGALRAFKHKGMGNVVEIIKDAYRVRYMHLDSFEGGDRHVSQGDIIGYTGNTGRYTTANHLHMDVKKDGIYINPTDMLIDEVMETDFDKWNRDPSKNIAGLGIVISKKYGIPVVFNFINGVATIFGEIKGIKYKRILDNKMNAIKTKI